MDEGGKVVSMDEDRIAQLLVEATDHVAGRSFDPEDDLRRGRAARRRRRTAATTAAVLGSAAAVLAALSLSGQLAVHSVNATAAPGGGPNPGPSPAVVQTPATSPSSATLEPPSATTVPPASTSTTTSGLLGVPPGADAFNRLLFSVAQDHVDPDHNRLQWSEGFTGSPGGAVKEWGRKFGWQVAGERGQAMFYFGVGNIPASDRLPCGQYDYQGSTHCANTVLPNGQQAEVLNSATRHEVHWSRPDGTYVFVIVDAVFGNNTTVASKAPLPTVAQLQELVMDPRLVLPAS